ncbi:unnamed protein product, partial [Arabidopsis halleri]
VVKERKVSATWVRVALATGVRILTWFPRAPGLVFGPRKR